MREPAYLYLQLSPKPGTTAEEIIAYWQRLDSLAVTMCGEGAQQHMANWTNHGYLDFWVAHPNSDTLGRLKAAWLAVPAPGETGAVVDEGEGD
jgi:hypothetical protein